MSLRSSLLVVVACLGFATKTFAEPPPGFTESVVESSGELSEATGIAWAPDGSNRLFVILKGGAVRVFQNGSLRPTAFATIRPIFTNSECGLIGMCFDPDFVNNRYVYFFVTVSGSEQRIIRYTDANSVGTDATVIVEDLPTDGQNHDGGGIGIGPDGALYWSIGDLGNGTGINGNLSSLASKVGRADRFTGEPIPDNPFADGNGPNNEYIWARGFRNPFTMTFQPTTGALWLNVVGTVYEQIFLVERGDHGGYNNYENNQPAGFLPPKIVYQTNGSDTNSIAASGAVRSNNVVTFTTTSSNGFRSGSKAIISGVGNASFNGEFFVRERLSNTSFTVTQSGPDAVSGGGVAQTEFLGGAVTGGCFYDSTLFPAEYRGNFFFGDFNSANVMRATLNANNRVTSVGVFVTDSAQQVDIATGPDGALYYIGLGGILRKLVPASVTQGLVVSPTVVQVQEGGSSVFTVRLAEAPASSVTVNVAAVNGGDADLSTSASTLTFTPENWDRPQTVVVQAAVDADISNGEATFQITANSLPMEDVVAKEIDAVVQTAAVSTLLYRTGDSVPGETPETTFAGFGMPSLDGTAHGFLAQLKTGTKEVPAIFGGGSPGILVRAEDSAPGTDAVFQNFKDPVFAQGNLAFLGTLATGPGVTRMNNEGIWSGAPDALILLAREGTEAPGAADAVYQSFLSLALPESGGAVFVAKLKTSPSSAEKVTRKNDVGLWREVGGAPQLILREGDQLTLRGGPGRIVRSFEALPIVPGSEDQRRSHRANGDLFIKVKFDDGAQAILLSGVSGGAPTLEVLTGDTVTTPAGGTLKSIGLPASNAAAVAFAGSLNSDANVSENAKSLIFVGTTGGGFAAKARQGDIAPDADEAMFASFGTPALIGSAPSLLFSATLKRGTGTPKTNATNDMGLWTDVGGTLRLIAREGAAAPGTGGRFAKILSFAADQDANPVPLIAFTARLARGRDGVNASNNSGLWARGENGNVILLRQTGQTVAFPDGRSAKVTGISAIKSSRKSPAQGRSINGRGQIIYRLNLSGRQQAIYLDDLP
jgi:glucose/arabinose dehydrogenase